jgi:septal ring factor EnvC (AmiA/AmiB activator)
MRYLREYSVRQKEEARRIIEKQNEITLRKAELEKTRNEKQQLLTQRAQENKKLEEEQKLQRKEVAELNKKQRELQKQLQEKKREANALNRHIEMLIAEDSKTEEATPATPATTPPSAAASSPDAPEKTSGPEASYPMTETELLLSNDFAANKGRLPFPITGNFTVISQFGKQQHQELSYVRTNNNGIDLQTISGTEACAIFNGIVTRVFVMPGYNSSVIIRHGDYLTVYSNLNPVYVKAGERVVTRQPLGKIFTDIKKGNETILHFQIWKERTKLNPSSWMIR